MKKIILLLFLIPNLVMSESQTCNCSEIDCIDASYADKTLPVDDNNSIKYSPKIIRIKATLGCKNVIDDYGFHFSSPILIFNKGKCISGMFWSEPLVEHYERYHPSIQVALISPLPPSYRFTFKNNMTHVELLFDGKKRMEFYKKNFGNEVLVTGIFKRAPRWDDTTRPFKFYAQKFSDDYKNCGKEDCYREIKPISNSERLMQERLMQAGGELLELNVPANPPVPQCVEYR
mgnify:FL=1